MFVQYQAVSQGNEAQSASGILGDRLMLAAIALSAAAAVALGLQFIGMGLAITASLGLCLMAVLAYLLVPGTLCSRLVLSFVQVGLVVVHIQLARGQLEYHFGVFVTLALLLVYLDWRPVVWATALFAVHHVLFDRLQAAGWALYCTTEADFARVVLHAAYLIIQTALEVVLVVQMGRTARESAELQRLAASLLQGDRLVLDVGHIEVQTPGGKALKLALERMHDTVATVQQASSEMMLACDEIASGAQDLSVRTDQTAGHLQNTSARVERITAAMGQTAEASAQANAMAQSASDIAGRGGAVVGQVVSTMREISEDAARIADITGVIDSIAFQTNILALNAAVEAARAGDHGRGFSVVAAEVRQLAQRSAQAAREIATLINTSSHKVSKGQALADVAGGTMTDIVSSIARASDVMGGIHQAARDQALRIDHLNGAVAEVDQMTQQNAALVEESAAAAASLKEQSERLGCVVAVFSQRSA